MNEAAAAAVVIQGQGDDTVTNILGSLGRLSEAMTVTTEKMGPSVSMFPWEPTIRSPHPPKGDIIQPVLVWQKQNTSYCFPTWSKISPQPCAPLYTMGSYQ